MGEGVGGPEGGFIKKALDSVNRLRLLERIRAKLGNTEECRVWEKLLAGTDVVLNSPWGQSEFKANRGIRQGAVESPMFFAAITEWILLDTISKYGWKNFVTTYPDLQLTQTAYMDYVMLWDGSSIQVQERVRQLALEFAEWGLAVNTKKCHLYVSLRHQGPSSITVNGVRLDAEPKLSVMGVDFRVGGSVHELLQGTWQKAKKKFWANKHLLCANTPIRGRMRMLDRVVGGAALWNCAAFFPEPLALEAINNLLYQFTIWMLKPRKSNLETVSEYHFHFLTMHHPLAPKTITTYTSTFNSLKTHR